MPSSSDDGSINVLLIGSGGREHALALAITRSPRLGTLFIANPGNPGIDALGVPTGVPCSIREVYRLQQFCDAQQIGLVIIGPEDPLAEGFADKLASDGHGKPRAVFGPTAKGARLEADKAYAKKLMRAAGVPTGDARVFTDYDAAAAFVEGRQEPVVIKAAGLAKGKGVVVPTTKDQALEALDAMLRRHAFGNAGQRVLVEERLEGPEISVLALCDGRNIRTLPLCQDHKRLRDGDEGPNTGGMGAFCPASTLEQEAVHRVERDILVPIIDALRREDDVEFRGVLYAGLMLTHAGPKVLEFNTRFGDPECQALMVRLRSDALEMMLATAQGRLDDTDVAFSEDASCCVVFASEGYPEKPRTGVPIHGLDDQGQLEQPIEGVTVHHAGTRRTADGKIVTAGGRVLGITATGASLDEARERAYQAAAQVSFAGAQMRADIAGQTG